MRRGLWRAIGRLHGGRVGGQAGGSGWAGGDGDGMGMGWDWWGWGRGWVVMATGGDGNGQVVRGDARVVGAAPSIRWAEKKNDLGVLARWRSGRGPGKSLPSESVAVRLLR